MPCSYIASVTEETVRAAERGFTDAAARGQSGGNTVGSSTGARFYGNSLAFIYGTYHPPVGPAYGKWIYPVMYGAAAGLFASRYFGDHHTFVGLGHAGDATTLGFCARSRTEPEIEGELEVSSDTLLLGARWLFRMPHHEEDAGGEATFGESHLDGTSGTPDATPSSNPGRIAVTGAAPTSHRGPRDLSSPATARRDANDAAVRGGSAGGACARCHGAGRMCRRHSRAPAPPRGAPIRATRLRAVGAQPRRAGRHPERDALRLRLRCVRHCRFHAQPALRRVGVERTTLLPRPPCARRSSHHHGGPGAWQPRRERVGPDR